MTSFLLTVFCTIACLSLVMFQFPTKVGIKGIWFEELHFIKPLTFFIFLGIPLPLIYFELKGADDIFYTSYSIGALYFIAASLRDKKVGINVFIALVFICFVSLFHAIQLI